MKNQLEFDGKASEFEHAKNFYTEYCAAGEIRKYIVFIDSENIVGDADRFMDALRIFDKYNAKKILAAEAGTVLRREAGFVPPFHKIKDKSEQMDIFLAYLTRNKSEEMNTSES